VDEEKDPDRALGHQGSSYWAGNHPGYEDKDSTLAG